MDFKNRFELCDSMEVALIIEANELGVEPTDLLDAILFAFFWHNSDALKAIYHKKGI